MDTLGAITTIYNEINKIQQHSELEGTRNKSMLNKVKDKLNENNILFAETTVNHGVKLTTINNVHITVFGKGTVLIQGKEPYKSDIFTVLGFKLNN